MKKTTNKNNSKVITREMQATMTYTMIMDMLALGYTLEGVETPRNVENQSVSTAKVEEKAPKKGVRKVSKNDLKKIVKKYGLNEEFTNVKNIYTLLPVVAGTFKGLEYDSNVAIIGSKALREVFDYVNGVNDSMAWEQFEDILTAVAYAEATSVSFDGFKGYYPQFSNVQYNYVDKDGNEHLCGFYKLITQKMHKGTNKKHTGTRAYELRVKVTPCKEVKKMTESLKKNAGKGRTNANTDAQ